MLAYAANSSPARRDESPRALMLVIVGHIVVIGAVLTTKMGAVRIVPADPITVVNIPTKPPPKPSPPEPAVEPRPAPQASVIATTSNVVDVNPVLPVLSLDAGPPIVDVSPVAGGGSGGTGTLDPPALTPVRVAALFRTPQSAIKPPYPIAKIRSEEEATLKLRLSIDERGRVVDVQPVGIADPTFLAAAQRHIMRSWRYKPATEDGVPVRSSTVISLSFRLDDS